MKALKPARVIRTVSDLVTLSDAELVACLRTLREHLQARKRDHMAALAAGHLPAGTPMTFEEFRWQPHNEVKAERTRALPANTSVRDLPIRRRARIHLEEMKVLQLEDLSAISELELSACKDIGSTTVAQLRDLLHEIGLDFAEHPDPEMAERIRARALMRLEHEQQAAARVGLPDDAPIVGLGLRWRTVERMKRAGWTTVGELRDAALLSLSIALGKSQLKEVVAALNETGQGLRCNPTQLELWRAGLLEVDAMQRPTDDKTPVEQIRPWVGSVVGALSAAGVGTLGALRAAAVDGSLPKMRGVGPDSEERLLAFLGMRAGQPTRSRSNRLKAADGQPLNSIFAVGRSLKG